MTGNIFFLIVIPISFSIFLIIWYGIILRKLYEDMQNIAHEATDIANNGVSIIRRGIDWMEKNIFGREPKPPKNRQEFWEIFVKTGKNISKNENELEEKQIELKEKHLELEKELQEVKKYNWIPIIVAILVVVFTVLNYGLYLHEVSLHDTEVKLLLEEKYSHVYATEEIMWANNYQLYSLDFENRGEIEYNLLVEIKFPHNCSIDNKSLPLGGEFQLIDGKITWDETKYTAMYSNIRQNQHFSVRIRVRNDDLIGNRNLTISPDWVQAWTDKGRVKINYNNG